MKPQSAKAKGRRLQQQVAKLIQDAFGLSATEVKSLPMGAPGEDIWLSGLARAQFPFSVECKNTEAISIHKAFKQAVSNTSVGTWPLLVHSKNHSEVLAVLRLADLLQIMVERNEFKA